MSFWKTLFSRLLGFRFSRRHDCRCLRDHCDQGALRFSFFRSPILEVARSGNVETIEFPPPEHVQQPMIEAVNDYFRGEGDNPCDAATKVKVMEMIDGLSGED